MPSTSTRMPGCTWSPSAPIAPVHAQRAPSGDQPVGLASRAVAAVGDELVEPLCFHACLLRLTARINCVILAAGRAQTWCLRPPRPESEMDRRVLRLHGRFAYFSAKIIAYRAFARQRANDSTSGEKCGIMEKVRIREAGLWQTAILRKTRETRVRGGHPWLYASEIETTEGECAGGDVHRRIQLQGHVSRPRALQSPLADHAAACSPRRMKRWTRPFSAAALKWPGNTESASATWTVAAWSIRSRTSWPGLIVDKFADVLSMQTLSLGMDMRKEMLARFPVRDHRGEGRL